MILPKHKLDEIDYYGIEVLIGEYATVDYIIVHWKKWWKPRTKFAFSRIIANTRVVGDEIIRTFHQNSDFVEMRNQLFEYFK